MKWTKQRLNNLFFLLGVAAVVVMLFTFDVSFVELWQHLCHAGYWLIPIVGVWILIYGMNALSWQTIIRVRGTGEFIDMQLSSFTGGKLLNVLKGMTTWGKIPFLYYALFFILVGVVLTFVVKDLPKRTALIGTGGLRILGDCFPNRLGMLRFLGGAHCGWIFWILACRRYHYDRDRIHQPAEYT